MKNFGFKELSPPFLYDMIFRILTPVNRCWSSLQTLRRNIMPQSSWLKTEAIYSSQYLYLPTRCCNPDILILHYL
jgi:hypothetical protein